MADDNKIIAEILVEGVDKFKADLKGAQTSVETLNAEVSQTGDVSKQAMSDAAKSTEGYRTQLRNMTADLVGLNLQLAEMKDAGKAGTKEFADLEKRVESLRKKAGDLKDAMQDANDQIKATGSDTAGIDKAIRVVGSATAAFQVFEGAAVLAGKGNEDLQKALVKLNAVMAITQGLQQVQNELVRDDSVFKGIAAGATRIYTAAQNTLAKATGLVRVALAGLGIGAVIGLIYAAVQAYKSFTGQTEELADATERLRKEQEKQNDALAEEIRYRVNIGKITAQQGAQEALAKAKKDQVDAQKNLNDLLTQEQTLINRISDSEGQTQLLADLQKLQAKIPEAKKLFNDTSDAVNKAEKELDGFKEKTKETKDEIDKAAKSTLNWRDTIRHVVTSLGASSQPMTEAIRLFREYNTGISKTAEEATRAAEEIAAAQQKIQQSVSGGNVTRATGVQTREQELQGMFEKAQGYYNQIQGVISQSLDVVANASAVRAEREIQALDKKRQRGLISEKQYEKEIAKIKNEQARKTKIANTIEAFAAIPLAVLNALTSVPFPANIAAAAIVGALATAQAALVAAAPLPKFRDGGSVAKRLGLIKGKSHEAGGVPIEVEGDEFVMSKKAVKHYGVDFMDKVNNLKLSPVVTMSPKLDQMKQTDYKLYEHLATLGGYMKQDYRTNERALNVLAEINQGVRAGRKRYV